ncbi:unnamed protein product [Caenorhabditis sp. 36 PRJEB53466]|nr:unnamed protein product [Caenorhabditis sp. 36 PRJEB53466]
MSRHFVSAQAQTLSMLYLGVRYKILDKFAAMDFDTREVVIETLIQKIELLDDLLQNRSVRGHGNPAIRTPLVDVRSSLKGILLRLKHQVDSAATLADEAQLGAPANAAEQAALSRVDEVLRALNDAISPSSLIDNSATETD